MNLGEEGTVRVRVGGPDDGMHPTRNGAAVKLNLACARVMPGVVRSLSSKL